MAVDGYLTITEAEQWIQERYGQRVARSTIQKAAREGDFPAYMLGKTWLVKPADLQRWMETDKLHRRRGRKPRER